MKEYVKGVETKQGKTLWKKEDNVTWWEMGKLRDNVQ